MQGRIIKGIAGFYYVYDVVESVIYECKAKGIFRKEKIKPHGSYQIFYLYSSAQI